MNKLVFDMLVVDNDHELCETLRNQFSKSGFDVRTADNGEQALNLAQIRNFDVAIFDMTLPDMSGLELLKQFRVKQHDCEVILLAPPDAMEAAEKADDLGAYDYLSKPFRLQTLEHITKKAVELRRLRKEVMQLKSALQQMQHPEETDGQSAIKQETYPSPEGSASPVTDDLNVLQRNKVVEVLRREHGNKSKAARTLHIERRKLYRLMEKYNITETEIGSTAPNFAPAVQNNYS